MDAAVMKKPKTKSPEHPPLSERETSVLRLTVAGKTNAEIGEELGIGYETVKSYVNRLRTKLGVRTKTALAVFAVQNQLV